MKEAPSIQVPEPCKGGSRVCRWKRGRQEVGGCDLSQPPGPPGCSQKRRRWEEEASEVEGHFFSFFCKSRMHDAEKGKPEAPTHCSSHLWVSPGPFLCLQSDFWWQVQSNKWPLQETHGFGQKVQLQRDGFSEGTKNPKGSGMSTLGALLCSRGLFSLLLLQRRAAFARAPRLLFWLSDHRKINKGHCRSPGGLPPPPPPPGPAELSPGCRETWTHTHLCFWPT